MDNCFVAYDVDTIQHLNGKNRIKIQKHIKKNLLEKSPPKASRDRVWGIMVEDDGRELAHYHRLRH